MHWSKVELVDEITQIARELPFRPRIMEICGTHTYVLYKYGIKSLLADAVDLVSGPGCPVCVTPPEVIDLAVDYAYRGYIVATFGDMARVPGTRESDARARDLLSTRAEGGDIRIVSSPLAVINIASAAPGRKVVFLAVGFETTAPGTALLLQTAVERGLKNLYLLPAHRLIPPVLDFLLSAGEFSISGLIAPGHVAAVTGIQPYRLISAKYRIPSVISGFEAMDVLSSIYYILRLLKEKQISAVNQYSRAVRAAGNPKARKLVERFFMVFDAFWRGLGAITRSGLRLREEFSDWDAANLPVSAVTARARARSRERGQTYPNTCPGTPSACRCGEVLRGVITPRECPEYSCGCTPGAPLGPCMVSMEGACRIYYQYCGEEMRDNVRPNSLGTR